ncbi:ultraviolet-B receptor UVR8 isoform X3 [Cryptomeria japonica]|uniref:ultraviolet-B receptor UVR8 isoform X3 n=1 Tax=Cryptomeria japonica TaxID=3369 RepID=UPI0027DA3468|nr:ultraviolet-B receptor UVR8 isoform X3 [Cryptomeria japonica]
MGSRGSVRCRDMAHKLVRWGRGIGSSSGEKKKRWAALWGNGDYGRLGLGSLQSRWEPTLSLCSSPSSIACGGAHTLLLTEQGRVLATGLNDYGQLGVPFGTRYTQEPVEVAGLPDDICQIFAGYYHSAAISEKGVVYAWGNNFSGQLGLGKDAPKKVCIANEVKPLNGLRIKMIALGSEHSLALTEDGEVLSWGLGENGRLGHGYESSMFRFLGVLSEYTPKLIKSLEMFKVVIKIFSVYRTNGDVYTWGSNENGCLGLGSHNLAPSPERVQGSLLPLHVSEISCGWKHTAVISGGNVFVWGWGGSQGTFSDDGLSSGGQLGLGNELDYHEPTKIGFGEDVNVLQISCRFNHTGAIIEEK